MKSKHQLAHASFTIYQDVEPPEFWTNYFAVVPDMAGVSGERLVRPSGRMSAGALRVGLWSISSEKAIQSDALTPHLCYLVERLALPRADLRELLGRTRAQMRFFCYWVNESGERVPDIPEDIRTMMEALGGTIEIDEYRN
jgi:hypothetical protein